MFTGIVTGIGHITEVVRQAGQEAGVRVRIAVTDFPLQQTKLGDSIAVQGACMTVVAQENQAFWVDVSAASLMSTTGLDRVGTVNVEHSLRLGDALDGHLVFGHVDDVAYVADFSPVGESWHLGVDMPVTLAPYLARKGSVAINGVSLTINQVEDLPTACRVWMNLIPHTVQRTTLQFLQVGSAVNVEVDMLARYVARMHALAS